MQFDTPVNIFTPRPQQWLSTFIERRLPLDDQRRKATLHLELARDLAHLSMPAVLTLSLGTRQPQLGRRVRWRGLRCEDGREGVGGGLRVLAGSGQRVTAPVAAAACIFDTSAIHTHPVNIDAIVQYPVVKLQTTRGHLRIIHEFYKAGYSICIL